MAPPKLPSLRSIETRDRLVGHLNHLTPAQTIALDGFKTKLAADGFYTPATETEEASSDEPTLLRFLRARKFDVAGAYEQFTSSEKWRREAHVAETYDDHPVPEFKETEKVYPQWTGRRDKAGLPVYVFKINGLTKDAINKYNAQPERLDVRMIALYEHMVQFVLPFCSSVPHSHQEVPISATTTIVDISDVSLSRFWALRSHMQRASNLANQNYAETLGTIYIVGAPGFFSVVWGWIGKWFDPGTVEKIFILKHDEVLSTLTRFIEPENIPKQFGGELPWAYGDINGPSLDEAEKETLGLDECPRGSIRWVRGEVVIKGTGRTPEELAKCTPKKKAVVEEKAVPVVAPVAVVTPVAEKTVEQAVAEVEAGKALAPSISDDATIAVPADGEGAGDHDIWTTAKDNVAAPVKDLAATLEGTTL
ncbi:hypothetical protein P7C70_g4329, partial [Phenoliferia sp. Uapishka_3]